MKRFLAIILVFLAVSVSAAWAEPTLYSDPIQAKTAKADVNIRAETNKKSKRLAQIKKAGTEMTVLGEELDRDHALWYYVRTVKGTEGYVRSDLLELDEQDEQQDQSEEDMEPQNIWSPEDPEYWVFMREHYGIPEGFLDAAISSSSASYTAGLPITMTVTINGGVPPFAIRWSVNEPWYEDGHILDDYWRAGDYKECTGEYTTESSKSSFDIVMPLQGKDVYVMVDIQDGEKRISNIENYYITSAVTGEQAQTETLPPAGTTGVVIGDQWQEIFLADLPTSEMATPEIYLFTISGTDLANMPVGSVLGRYTFRAGDGPRDEIITISKPKLPATLANRLSERQESYLLYRMRSSRGSWSNMLIVFPQAENCSVTAGYNWFESRVHSVVGLGFSCQYWHLRWSDTYFSGMALNYPNTEVFSLAEDTEPSMNDVVTESYFPIPDSYLKLVLNYIGSPASSSDR